MSYFSFSFYQDKDFVLFPTVSQHITQHIFDDKIKRTIEWMNEWMNVARWLVVSDVAYFKPYLTCSLIHLPIFLWMPPLKKVCSPNSSSYLSQEQSLLHNTNRFLALKIHWWYPGACQKREKEEFWYPGSYDSHLLQCPHCWCLE